MSSAESNDRLLPFLMPAHGVRGFAVEITQGLREMLAPRAYPPAIARLLGQALAATPLLAADLRDGARLNLQFRGTRGLTLLVTQADAQLQVRGMAKITANADGDFRSLMGGGVVAMMIDPGRGRETYQALVEALGDSLAEALEIYFKQSEQLPTLLRLAASDERISGVLLQRLPEGGSDSSWEHVQVLFGTLTEDELASVDALTVLRRLFHEEELRVFDSRPVQLACRCSHASISAMLLALGEAELEPVLAERGKVEVTCEFCGSEYVYDPVQVRELFAAQKQKPDPNTKLN